MLKKQEVTCMINFFGNKVVKYICLNQKNGI